MQDELAVRRVIEAYADAVTRRDAAAYGAMYAPEAVWIVGPPVDRRVEGRDAIVAELSSEIARLDFFVFTAANIVVSVTGDTASSRSTVHEVGRAMEGAGPGLPAMEVRALYEDELRRDGDGWVFTKRRYSILYLDTTVPAGQAFPLTAS
ncbi:nuclear transport factor 2 family protein [Mycolicibacterium sp. XJ1819]